MTRREYMLACFLKSLRNRLWVAVLPTVAVGLVLAVLQVPWGWSAGLEILTLLSLVAVIVRSSYLRHRHEFDHYQKHRVERSST